MFHSSCELIGCLNFSSIIYKHGDGVESEWSYRHIEEIHTIKNDMVGSSDYLEKKITFFKDTSPHG